MKKGMRVIVRVPRIGSRHDVGGPCMAIHGRVIYLTEPDHWPSFSIRRTIDSITHENIHQTLDRIVGARASDAFDEVNLPLDLNQDHRALYFSIACPNENYEPYYIHRKWPLFSMTHKVKNI